MFLALDSALPAFAGTGLAGMTYSKDLVKFVAFRIESSMIPAYASFGAPEPNVRDVKLYETTLSGDLAGNDINVNDPCVLANDPNRAENAYHVVTTSNTAQTAILDGFTITGGNANESSTYGGGIYNSKGSPTIICCTMISNLAELGAGMYNYNAAPTITNCIWNGNRANYGAGIYSKDSEPNITSCILSRNIAETSGGGIYDNNSSPVLTDCTFTENSANYAGGMYNYQQSNPIVNNCKFIGNSAINLGGGMYNKNSSPSVIFCTLIDNTADHGAGTYNNNGSPAMTNCIFSGNSASYAGGMWNSGASGPTLTNCTFSANSAVNLGGGMYNSSSTPTITNCVFWGNSDWGGYDESAQIDGSSPIITYSCVQALDTFAGPPGNIGDNPLFVDPDGSDNIIGTEDDNLRLSFDSSCIDVGDNTAVPAGITTDFDSRPRIIDGDCNGTDIVDMGAYEFSWVSIGDFAGGCDVDFEDFAVFASAWLTEPGLPAYNTNCDISLPVDNRIDMLDLDVFTNNWLVGKTLQN
ncbi:MAG: right-handed parallel beta-helix repeat-containing protein [Sedimentisphaerales bacterium]|nr:right-handed parallel beta-helix repeat-containing protein [Sedimentisphaerales bacterium]